MDGRVGIGVLLVVVLLSTGCASQQTAGSGARQSTASTQPAPSPPATRASRAASLREARAAAVRRVVRGYYQAIDRRRFAAAWARLSPAMRSSMGSYEQWRAGYETSLHTTVTSLTATRVGATRASVGVALKAVDVDACGDRVTQRFAGTWTLTKTAGRWSAAALRIDKTAGPTPRTSVADCLPDQSSESADNAPTAPEQSSPACDPSYEGACLDPNASDYDCEGGSGDGPEYTGTVQVEGDDHFGLDRDGDGIGCE